METVHSERVDLPQDKEGALRAYDMATGMYRHNLLLEMGEEPTDADGNVLGVQYQYDVPGQVRDAYGNTSEVDNAIIAAHEVTHPEQ